MTRVQRSRPGAGLGDDRGGDPRAGVHAVRRVDHHAPAGTRSPGRSSNPLPPSRPGRRRSPAPTVPPPGTPGRLPCGACMTRSLRCAGQQVRVDTSGFETAGRHPSLGDRDGPLRRRPRGSDAARRARTRGSSLPRRPRPSTPTGRDEDRTMTRRRGGRSPDERGSISVWAVTIAPAMIILAGLAVDGGGKVHAEQRAMHLAAEAARVGGQQLHMDQAVHGVRATSRYRASAGCGADLPGRSGRVRAGERARRRHHPGHRADSYGRCSCRLSGSTG